MSPSYHATRRILVGLLLIGPLGCDMPGARPAWAWVRAQAEPGSLDPAHAKLDLECTDCHTPLSGVEASTCIACHALNDLLVQRQTTSFHAEVRVCADCHVEHSGGAGLLTPLDHELLAGLEMRAGSLEKASLDCRTCHGNRDPHFGLLGDDCSDCHETATWDVVAFTHPSPRSRDCSQCHQAPPSHYMEHFKMLSAKVARKPQAEVSECFQCHLTTAWPDIRGIGFYKHH